MAERLTKWEGRDENGPRAVLAKEGRFPDILQESLRKLARYEDEEEKMTLAERIIEFRTREDLSCAGLAARAGLDRSTIHHAENGKRVSRKTEEKIERVLKGEADD